MPDDTLLPPLSCSHEPLARDELFDLDRGQDLANSQPDTVVPNIVYLFRWVLHEVRRTVEATWPDDICETGVRTRKEFRAELAPCSCGKHALYVDANVLITLHAYFCRLLSHPETLPEIKPRPTNYVPPQMVLWTPKGWESNSMGRLEAPGAFGNPRDLACNFLAFRALLFLLMHELSHVVEIVLDLRNPAEITNTQKRGLEHLADLHAARRCLEAERSNVENEDLGPHSLRLWGFSICTFWRVFEQFHPATQEATTHPNLGVRALWFEGYVHTHFQHLDGIQDVLQGIKDADEAWNRVGWPSSPEPGPADLKRAGEDVEAALNMLTNAGRSFLRM